MDTHVETVFAFDWTPTPGRLTGRTALVTGANAGLGLETAIHLAKMTPAKLILAVRSVEKGEAARVKIAEASGLDASAIEVWQLDMASFDNVKQFAKRANESLDRLDVLVENAGVAPPTWDLTADGWESTLQVNGLATGLLGVSLLPLLAKTAPLPAGEGATPLKPHLTIVGSGSHAWLTYTPVAESASVLSDFNDEKSANTKDRYFLSKLISLFISRKIASLKLTREAGVVVNNVCPGSCSTEITRDYPPEVIAHFAKAGKPASEGAKNIAEAAVKDEWDNVYISLMKVEPTSEFSRSAEGLELERRLWAEMSSLWLGVDSELKTVLA